MVGGARAGWVGLGEMGRGGGWRRELPGEGVAALKSMRGPVLGYECIGEKGRDGEEGEIDGKDGCG